MGAAGIAGIVVAGLAVAAAIGFGVHRAASGGHKQAPLGQTTLLFSLANSAGAAGETALLAHDDRTRQGVELLVPGRLLTEVCGFGNRQVDQILALPDGQRLARGVVSDLLGGVTVDGSWVLTAPQLAKLVDDVGGVTVDVDADVVQRRADGSRVLVVSKGPDQHLNGARAVAFATYLASGEESTDNLVRLQAVLDGLLAALPADQAKVQDIVGALGPGTTSTLGAARLSRMLTGLASDAKHNDVLPSDLPVIKIESGSAQPSYRVDATQTASFVKANLGASLPASARVARTRVLVENGVGTPGLVVGACSRLVDAGFAFAGSRNADHFGYPTSKVLVFDRSVATARKGNAVARALRLPVGDVAVDSSVQSIADVIVILGKDYKP